MRLRLTALAALLVVLLAACDGIGTSNSSSDSNPDPAGSACLVGTPDCVDAILHPDAPVTGGDRCLPDIPGCTDTPDVDEAAAVADAEALLGLGADELDPSVRISRAGDEQMVLTEDYVIGRITVELDPDADGVLRVVSATVELTDGPVTVEVGATD